VRFSMLSVGCGRPLQSALEQEHSSLPLEQEHSWPHLIQSIALVRGANNAAKEGACVDAILLLMKHFAVLPNLGMCGGRMRGMVSQNKGPLESGPSQLRLGLCLPQN